MRETTLASTAELRPILQGEAIWPLIWYLHDREYSYLPDLESSDESGALRPYLESANLRMQEIDEIWAVRTLKLAVKDLKAASRPVRVLVEHFPDVLGVHVAGHRLSGALRHQ